MIASLIAATVFTDACASAGNPRPPADVVRAESELDGIAASVAKALPAGVKLLSVHRQGESIVLDFSEELLAVARGGELEDTLHRLMAAASSARTLPRPRVEDYRILINGVPLEKRLP